MQPKLLDKNGRFALKNLLRSRRGAWFLAWIIGAFTLIATVGLLTLSGWFISAAAFAGVVSLSTAYTFNYLIPSGMIRFFAIVRTAGRYGERMTSHNAVLALLADLRSAAFAKFLQTPFSQQQSITRMHRLTGDIDLLNNWPLSVILPWTWAAFIQLLALVLTFLFAPTLALWMIVPLLAAGILVPLIATKQSETLAYQEAQQAETRRSALLQPLPALTALLQWQTWAPFERDFLHASAQYDATQNRAQRHASNFVLYQHLIFFILFAILLWRGSLLVSANQLSTASLLAVILCMFALEEILLPLSANAMAVGLSKAAKNRLNALLENTTANSHSDAHNKPIPQAPWQLEAKHLDAKYPSALTGAKDVNFSLKAGDVLIINGASGLGKSTLLTVLAGEMPATGGDLLLNGENYDHWQLNNTIAYLAQQLDIFDLSLASNLRLANKAASNDELWDVLDKVDLKTWAEAQPKKLNTRLGEYGAAVSGGQARRIALARLLLLNRPIMLVDEPFAGLDEQTHQHLLTMLKDEMKDGILIIVSHLDDAAQDVQHLSLN